MLNVAHATPIDPEIENLLLKAERTDHLIKSIVKQIELMILQPDPISRIVNNVSQFVDPGAVELKGKKNLSILGDLLLQYGDLMAHDTPQYSSLSGMSSAFKLMDQKWAEVSAEVSIRVIAELKKISHVEYANIVKSKSELLTTRVDMDYYKNQFYNGSSDPEVQVKCAELTSSFEVQSAKLKELLIDFCGELTETKVATCLEKMIDLLKEAHGHFQKILSF
ncbi:Endophilin-B1 [Thelohanellus kitauei]|uniref:Endophilin-B1 n=1 Tax=Thelohanellus kitauei TaxID=669202 RepID=A0A0C2IMS0_THEKT|nr:Endophilin-B1 [Thelohanellus kitauei]